MKIKLKPKIIISLILIALIVIVLVITLSSKKNNDYTLYTVAKSALSQEISETGVIKKGDKINLSFKSAGEIKEIFVEIGDIINKGAVLAKLDNNQLYIQLEQAKAELQLVQAELDKLLAGVTKEEIQVNQNSVDNAETTLANEKKDIENAQISADQDIEDIYEDAFNVLNDSYLKLYNAFTLVKSIQNSHFTSNDQDSLIVKENKVKIENSLDEMDFYLKKVESDFTKQNIDFALVDFEKNFADSRSSLSTIRGIIEGPVYRNIVSSSDKTSLDTHRTNINTVYTNIVTQQQDTISIKITNKTNIDVAESAVSVAEDSLKVAEDNLALLVAEPRKEDLSLYQAKRKSAQARVDILESQIRDTFLRSPVEGTVTTINGSVGEMIPAISPIMSVLPAEPFQIKVDIYEEDIIKIHIGNPAKISLVAFSEEIFDGKVIFIEPAEKLIDGVVYYEVNINFGRTIEGIKPGMTADVSIINAFKDGVLSIPEEAIEYKEDQMFVQVFKNNQIEERSVETGMEGSDDMIEIITGIEEGEDIIIEN